MESIPQSITDQIESSGKELIIAAKTLSETDPVLAELYAAIGHCLEKSHKVQGGRRLVIEVPFHCEISIFRSEIRSGPTVLCLQAAS